MRHISVPRATGRSRFSTKPMVGCSSRDDLSYRHALLSLRICVSSSPFVSMVWKVHMLMFVYECFVGYLRSGMDWRGDRCAQGIFDHLFWCTTLRIRTTRRVVGSLVRWFIYVLHME